MARPASVCVGLALWLWPVSVTHAAEEPKVTLEATLDAAHEVPSPSGTVPGAGGTAVFQYDETDKSITYTVTVTNLTGPPIAAHIHQATPGVPGPIRITLDQNNLAGGAPALPVPADLVEPLLDGGTYVNVHTASNMSGEIRGQIQLKAAACSCSGSAAALRQCVKQAIKTLEKSLRRSDVVKALKRDVKRSSCGRTRAPKKAVACCVRQPAGNIVTDTLCLPMGERACTKPVGTSLGAGSSCFPSNPCTSPARTPVATTTSTTLRRPGCVQGGGNCTTNSQCCSQYCYLGHCY